MNDSDKIKYFPKGSLKPYDGMSVTAEVWDVAHSEHRDAMRAHMLAMHRPGIICGLEIRANDPADHYVFISPGAAIDDMGRLIVVDQTIAYDFGDDGAGNYLLLIGYAEHEKENSDTKIKIMQHEYIIAARQTLPKQPVVELARVVIGSKGAVIRDAKDPFRPVVNELDLRFRNEVDDGSNQTVHVGVISIPSENDLVYQGWRAMVSSMINLTGTKLVVDMLSEVNERINDYDMLYIGAAGSFSLSETQKALLKNYYGNGKGILMEGLDAAGTKSLKEVADLFKVALANPDHISFFRKPFYFRIPPEQIEERHLYCAKRVIFCSDPLVSAWCGELDGELLARTEIRTNLEWGANLVRYCAR